MNTTPVGWVGYQPDVKVTIRKPLKVFELMKKLESADPDAVVRMKHGPVFHVKVENVAEEPFVLLV